MKTLFVLIPIVLILSNLYRARAKTPNILQVYGGTEHNTVVIEEKVQYHISRIRDLRHEDPLSDSYLKKSAKYAKRFFWEIDHKKSPETAGRILTKLIHELSNVLFFIPNDMRREREILNHINIIRRTTRNLLFTTFGYPYDSLGVQAHNDIMS